MNCVAFRRALDTAPRDYSTDMLAHRRQCPACEAFAQRHEDFERVLGLAARIDVPEDLASQILLSQGLRFQSERRFRRHRLILPVAASLILALVASWFALRPDPLGRDVVAHIEEESFLLAERGELSPEQVNKVLADLKIDVVGHLGTVHHASACWVHTGLGAHLILSGEKGPVTVLIMPGEPVARRTPIREARFRGVILPMEGGSIAIVGEPDETIDAVERRLHEAVRIGATAGPDVADAQRHLIRFYNQFTSSNIARARFSSHRPGRLILVSPVALESFVPYDYGLTGRKDHASHGRREARILRDPLASGHRGDGRGLPCPGRQARA